VSAAALKRLNLDVSCSAAAAAAWRKMASTGPSAAAAADAREGRKASPPSAATTWRDKLAWRKSAESSTTAGKGGIENNRSTDFESPHPPPRGFIKNRPSTDVESPPPRVSMSIHTQGSSCSDLGRVLVLNDPPARRRSQGS